MFGPAVRLCLGERRKSAPRQPKRGLRRARKPPQSAPAQLNVKLPHVVVLGSRSRWGVGNEQASAASNSCTALVPRVTWKPSGCCCSTSSRPSRKPTAPVSSLSHAAHTFETFPLRCTYCVTTSVGEAQNGVAPLVNYLHGLQDVLLSSLPRSEGTWR